MTRPTDNRQFYNQIDRTCESLRQNGMDAEANRVHYLLHNVAWTSTSELFRELASAFEELLLAENAAKLPQRAKEELKEYLELLADVLR